MEGGGSGEDRFIARFFRPLATNPAALALMDDAALLSPPEGTDLVLTVDALVAGVHFFPDDPADAVARKTLRVNLSDLAAKGASPLGAVLTLALPPQTPESWMEAFAIGLGADAALYGCPIIGGDTVKTPGPLTLSLTAFGAVPKGEFVPRTGARPGEAIIVTGTIGDAALGLMLRQEPGRTGFSGLAELRRAHLLERYLNPQPRLALAPALRAYASAAMDISDGLMGDVAKMLNVSGCGGVIHVDEVPLSHPAMAAVKAEPGLRAVAVTGGDDYEIACTVPLEKAGLFIEDALTAGIQASVIGWTRPELGLDVLDSSGGKLDFGSGSYSHF